MLSLPCSGTPSTYEVSDLEISGYQSEYPRVDVSRELDALRRNLEDHPERLGAYNGMQKRIAGWLRGSKPTQGARSPRSRRELGSDLQEKLDACIARGFVPSNFHPVGDNEEEQLNSLRARATAEWFRRYPDAKSDQAPLSQRLLWDPI